MKELIINKLEDETSILIVENGILTERYVEKDKNKRIEGNIYLGKVQNVLPGMQVAFVNIGENKNTLIHLKDILPKVDEKENNLNQEMQSINKLIRPGEKILVEVKRDSSRQKGARVSTHINLSGRYIVLMPNATFVTASQKIESNKEKERLISLLKDILPENTGAIIRTSAQKISKEEIEKDVNKLLKKWNKIKELSEKDDVVPRIIYENGGAIRKIVVDLLDSDLSSIVVNTQELRNSVNEILKDYSKEDIEVKIVSSDEILKMNDLESQIEKIKNRKIWLKCGGFITIDATEALTAIDVNSGKYIGSKDVEQTVFTVNQEATIEISKQLKLRDIGGIIIIDYIDMKTKENKEKILKELERELKKDRAKTQVEGFTKLNLVELTRKHICTNI